MDKGFNKILNKHRLSHILQHIKGDMCLEAGCGTGHMTKQLVKKFIWIEVIDIDQKMLDKVINHENVYKTHSTLESFSSVYKYDTILCTQVLEHVTSVEKSINSLKEHANKDSVFIFTVPNAKSVNRLIGVDLGLMPCPEHLDVQDTAVGHQRMFNPKTFRKLMSKHFKIVDFGTMIYKPLPNSMMTKLPQSVLKKMINMEVNELGAEIYAVCKLK